MKEYKPLLAVFFAILVMIFLFSQYRGCTEFVKVPPSEIDSLTAVYDEKLLEKDVQLTALQWEIRDLNMARKWDSIAIGRALATVKPLTSKVGQLIEANKDLKAANDTLSRLNNCDTLAEYAGYLVTQVDSLQSLLPHYQQTIDELVQVYDEALNAANDKALKQSAFFAQLRQAAKDCEDDRNKVITKLNNRDKRNRTKIIIAAAAGVAAGILISK